MYHRLLHRRGALLRISFGLAIGLGCAACAQRPPPQPILVESDGPGLLDAPGYVPPELEGKAADFRGSCNWARAPGSAALYTKRMQVASRAPGHMDDGAGHEREGVLVRASAVFLPDDSSNVLGVLPRGVTVYGDGPVYDARSGSSGYAVLVRGHTGRVCRGYVHASALQPAEDK